MANLTLAIDDYVLKRARLKAVRESTSVNAVVRDYLARYAGEDGAEAARRRLVDRARRSPASSGPRGRTWTREELYES